MIEIRGRESVIMAENYADMVQWYQDALEFELIQQFDEDFHYANLKTESGIAIGIADAKEMGVEPTDRSKNTVVLQFEVDDVKVFFEHLNQIGGVVTFGPSYEEKSGFWFGGFSDIEGNPFWVVDKNCP